MIPQFFYTLTYGFLLAVPSPAIVPQLADESFLTLHWQQPVVYQGFERRILESFGTPALFVPQNKVIVATSEGFVLAFSLKDGELLWKKKFPTAFECYVQPLYLNDVLAVVSSKDGMLYALDIHQGDIVWQTQLEGEVRSPMHLQKMQPQLASSVALEQLLYVTTSANKLYCLKAIDGEVIWATGKVSHSQLTIEGHASAIVSQQRLYTSFADGSVAAFDALSGKAIWQQHLASLGETLADADVDPLLIEDHLLISAVYNHGLYAFDTEEGQILWQFASPNIHSSYFDSQSGLLYAASGDGAIWGLKPKTGQVVFHTMTSPGQMSRMQILGDHLFLLSSEIGLLILNKWNGKPLQTLPFASRLNGDLALRPPYLTVLSGDGHLFVFSF